MPTYADLSRSHLSSCQHHAGSRGRSTSPLLGLLLLLLGLGLGERTWARAPYDLDLPADSPVWWTLSDVLSPAEMRATFRDRSAHLARYRRAYEAGLVQQLPEEGLNRLSFYVNPEQTPELTPMWRAFDVWASSFTELYSREALVVQLAGYDLSSATVDTLLRLADEYLQGRASIAAEIEPRQLEFVRVQRQVILSRAEAVGGHDGGYVVGQALASGDLEPFVEISGESAERIQELYAAWKTNPGAQSATTSLPRIRSELTPAEWNAFRRYLLQRVVAGIGPVMDFDAGKAARPRRER